MATKKAKRKRAPAKKAAKKAARKRAKRQAKVGEGDRALAAKATEALGRRITRDNVRRWRGRGYAVDDPDQLVVDVALGPRPPAWAVKMAAERKRAAAGEHAGAEAEALDPIEMKIRLLAAQLRRTEAEADLKELQAAAEREKWMTRAEAEEAGRQIGAVNRSYWLMIPKTFPPMLEGLSARQMEPKITAEVARVLEEVHRLMLEKEIAPE